MKVVFDTNVLISSTLWDGSVSQKLLYKLIEKGIPVYSSLEILQEYEEVLKREFDYSNEDFVNILEKVLSFITLVEPKEKVKVVKNDPDDNKIIECAIEADVDYILTYDVKHLLRLKEYKGIRIRKPEEIITTL